MKVVGGSADSGLADASVRQIHESVAPVTSWSRNCSTLRQCSGTASVLVPCPRRLIRFPRMLLRELPPVLNAGRGGGLTVPVIVPDNNTAKIHNPSSGYSWEAQSLEPHQGCCPPPAHRILRAAEKLQHGLPRGVSNWSPTGSPS